MAREIAVFRNDLTAAPLGEPGELAIFQRRQKVWEIAREKEFNLNSGDGLRGLRRAIGEVLELLGDCKIVVAKKVTGVIYYELEKAGVSIWEMEGNPYESLDELWDRSQIASQEDQATVIEAPTPVETGPGQYTISIKQMQEGNYGITSKQILMPIITKGDFRNLEISCNHVPPWLEGQLALSTLVWDIKRISEKEVKVSIRRPL